MLDHNDIKEHLSLCYVRAVAASCRFSVEETVVDKDSVDCTIRSNFPLGENASLDSGRLELQIKATTLIPHDRSAFFSYKLPVKNYNDLAGHGVVQKLLVILALPSSNNPKEYCKWSPNGLRLKKCAYWYQFPKGTPRSSNKTSKRIQIPRTQIFSPITLTQMLENICCEKRADYGL